MYPSLSSHPLSILSSPLLLINSTASKGVMQQALTASQPQVRTSTSAPYILTDSWEGGRQKNWTFFSPAIHSAADARRLRTCRTFVAVAATTQ